LKLHFRDLVQVAFWMPRRQKMISHGLSTPWNIALSTIRKSHFGPMIRQKMKSRIRQSLILFGPECRNFILRACQPLVISLSWHHPSRILGRPEGRNGISGPFDTLKHHFLELGQVAFYNEQKAQLNFFTETVYHMKYRFLDLT
jgi:hypothetical protein